MYVCKYIYTIHAYICGFIFIHVTSTQLFVCNTYTSIYMYVYMCMCTSVYIHVMSTCGGHSGDVDYYYD